MKLITTVNGAERILELAASANRGPHREFVLDGVKASADIQEVESNVYSILVGARSFEVKIEESQDRYFVTVNGSRYEVAVQDPRQRSQRSGDLDAAGPQRITSPMPGKVVRVMVKVGDQVRAGAGLLVIEAMKMQNEIKSPKTGNVTAIQVAEGGSVAAGDVMAVVE